MRINDDYFLLYQKVPLLGDDRGNASSSKGKQEKGKAKQEPKSKAKESKKDQGKQATEAKAEPSPEELRKKLLQKVRFLHPLAPPLYLKKSVLPPVSLFF